MKKIVLILMISCVAVNLLMSINFKTVLNIKRLSYTNTFEDKVYSYLQNNKDYYKKLKQKIFYYDDMKFDETTNKLKINGDIYYAPRYIPSDREIYNNEFNDDALIKLYTRFNVVYYGELIDKNKAEKLIERNIVQEKTKGLSPWIKYPVSALSIGAPIGLTVMYYGKYDSASSSSDASDFKKKTQTFQTVTYVSISANAIYYFYDDIINLFK